MIDVPPFAIFGDWDDTPTPVGRVRLVMPPIGPYVQGAGWEPFTQAGLRAVAEHLVPGMSFLEVGAGSAILSVAAKLAGARKAYAVELLPEAIATIPIVAAANSVAVEVVEGTYGDWRGSKEHQHKQRVPQVAFQGIKQLIPLPGFKEQLEDRARKAEAFEVWWQESDAHVRRHNAAVNGIPMVDLAIVSISSDFAKAAEPHIKARKVVAIHDDFTFEVLR